MGKIIVSSALSIDGFANGPGGDISVMPLDEGFNQHNASLIEDAAAVLYGAETYRRMLAYWPGVPDNPDASDAELSIAHRLAGGLPVVVVSDSLTPAEAGIWRDQTEIVSRADAHTRVARLRSSAGNTVIFGSLTVWTDLLAAGLVDELYLLLGPKIVAGDARAFAGVPETALRLLGVSQHPESSLAVLHFSVGSDAVK